MNDSALAAALDAVERASSEPAALSYPFVEMFPVSGAAVSTVGQLLGNETLSASDSTALRVDEIQFDLGEGPCWDALRARSPVLVPDVRQLGAKQWPAFSAAILGERVTSLFAFPLLVGPLRIGAVDLYAAEAVTLNPAQTRQAGAMADAVSKHVLRRALDSVGGEYDDVVSASSRRVIHQATGVVIAQLRIPADEARLLIQGQAFASSRPMMEIAREVLDGSMSFTRTESGIEVVS